MSFFNLNIITPEREFFSGQVSMVILKTIEGDMAIMKNRSPVMAVLKVGKAKVVENKNERMAQLDTGYVRVYDNNVTVVTKSAQWLE